MHEQSKNFKKEIENIKNPQTEMIELKTTITALKNTIRRFQQQTSSSGRKDQQT